MCFGLLFLNVSLQVRAACRKYTDTKNQEGIRICELYGDADVQPTTVATPVYAAGFNAVTPHTAAARVAGVYELLWTATT